MTRIRNTPKRALVVAVLAAVGATVGATGALRPFGDEAVSVTAVFTNASSLVVGNLVKASGVTVGEVSEVSLQGKKARVEMELERSLPLHTDARATIKPLTILGERYVALQKGSPEAPLLKSDAVIPDQRTHSAVKLQDVLNGLDEPTSSALGLMLTTLGEGVAGQGGKVAAAVSALKPALTRAGELASLLREQNAVLNKLVEQAAPVAQSVATERGRALDRLVGSATSTLQAVAQRRKALEATLERLPETLATARRTLSQLASTADATTSTLRGVRPLTDNLSATSVELKQFAETATPALHALRPVLDRAEELLNQAAPLVRELRAAGPDLRKSAQSTRKILSELTPALQTALDTASYWAMSTNGYDGVSHYFRGVAVLTPQSLVQTGAVPGLGPSQDSPRVPTPSFPELPGIDPSEIVGGDTPGQFGAPLLENTGDALTKTENTETREQPPPRRSATGLSFQQEDAMLEQLFGGW